MHTKVHPKAVGCQAYVQFITFAADNAVNERGTCTVGAPQNLHEVSAHAV